MEKKIVMVDDVVSITEALELESLGVDLIGVFINTNLVYGGEVTIDKATLIAIKNELKTAKLVGSIYKGFEEEAMLTLIDEVGLEYIQIVGHIFPSVHFRKELHNRGIVIIYSGIDASYDDCSSWILSRYLEKPDLYPSYYHVSFLGDVKDSWNFSKTISPQYSDQLQIADIAEIASEHPLLITYDFTVDNIHEIIEKIPAIKGITMKIVDYSEKNDDHCFSYDSVIAVLKELRNE